MGLRAPFFMLFRPVAGIPTAVGAIELIVIHPFALSLSKGTRGVRFTPPAHLRRTIGLLPQQFFLKTHTIAEVAI